MAELALVVPTYNEKDNIEPLIAAVTHCLQDIDWELVFVDDDSPDKTAASIRAIALRNPRIRVLHRVGRRGLSSACIEGILSTSSPYIAVMDADMQHDETALPKMLQALRDADYELAIGSRFVSGGSTGDMPQDRVKKSRFATRLAQRVLKTPMSDPMSGFFMLKREFFMAVLANLSGKGFKILLDLFVSAKRPVKFVEIPYVMRARSYGETKLDTQVMWEYLVLLADKFFGPLLPVRFIIFVAVGFTGVFVHLGILAILHKWLFLDFLLSHSIATWIAMTNNFVINNVFTYRDQKLKGLAFIRGLFSFYLACSIGAVINIVMARFLFDMQISWWMAGFFGAVIGSVWNYSITSVFTWKRKR